MSQVDVSKAAKTLSKLGASKGGQARAEKLTPEQRSEIGKLGSAARWGMPEAIVDGNLRINGVVIPCAVFEHDSKPVRVITENGITNALLGSRSGASKRLKKTQKEHGAPLPIFVAPRNLSPFISNDLLDGLLHPLVYRVKNRLAKGFPAELLPQICNVWLMARDAAALLPQQMEKCKKADILMRGLAEVGIIALVDEATGYQELRDRNALHKILELFIPKELLPWTKRFPDEYWKHIFRLKGWKFNPVNPAQGPRAVSQIINSTVYDKLPDGVVDMLKKKNPIISNGRRKYKNFQFLTKDIGNPYLERQITLVIPLLRVAPNWRIFQMLFDKAFPEPNIQLELTLDEGEAIWSSIGEHTE
jgi:hypothetical protein